jgi:ferrous-iron efflux pump FieF
LEIFATSHETRHVEMIFSIVVAALSVAAIVVYVSLQLGKRAAPLDRQEEQSLRTQIAAVVREVPKLAGYSRLHIRPGPGGHDVVLHCLVDPDLPVVDAHRLADQVEKLVHLRIADIKRVLVHVAPEGER